MKRALARVFSTLWAMLAVLGLVTAPLGGLVYPRLGSGWFPWGCGLAGLLLGGALAYPMVWALSVTRAEGVADGPVNGGNVPADAAAVVPREPEREGLFLTFLRSRWSFFTFAALGAVCFGFLAFGMGSIVNGLALEAPSVSLFCKLTADRMVTKSDREFVDVEYSCDLPSGRTISGDFTLVPTEVHLAHVGRRFVVPAKKGRLGVWVLESEGAVEKAANVESSE